MNHSGSESYLRDQNLHLCSVTFRWQPGIGLGDKPQLLPHIYIIIPRTPHQWLLLREGFMLLVFIHPLLWSNCYLVQALHFWWKEHWCGTFFLAADTQEYIGDLDNLQMDLLIKLGCQWICLYKLVTTVNCFPGFAGQVLQVTSVMQHLNS